MPCPAVLPGDQFLARALAHVDCQAQEIGSYGFQALASPGAPATLALTGLLTLFIALWGFRLMFGALPTARDAVSGVLKVGIVLTLALSWPAYRTLVYDVVLKGPAEIAATIVPPTLPAGSTGFANRLQNLDRGIVALTVSGSGRDVTDRRAPADPVQGYRGVALQDESGFAYGRIAFLIGVIAPLALMRLAAGLLLALGPLMAILLLFDATRGLFVGWIRGLVATMLGSLGITIVLAAQLAVLEPWLIQALNLRASRIPTPSAPTELLAMTGAFALVALGMLALLGWVAFHAGWARIALARAAFEERSPRRDTPAAAEPMPLRAADPPPSRAFAVAESVDNLLRREDIRRERSSGMMASPSTVPAGTSSGGDVPLRSATPLGESWRRTTPRTSASARRRDSAR